MFEIKLGVIQSKKINNNIKIVFLFWNFSSPHRRDRHDSSGSKRSGPSRFEGGGSGARGELFVTFSKLEIKYWMHLKTFYLSSLKYRAAYISLMYGFCKKSLRKDEPLTSWTLFFWAYLSSLLGGFAVAHSGFDVAPTQKWWQICSKKCSTDQRFIFLKWLFTISIL